MNYELYHDESKQRGYWHGMLLVPTETKDLLIKLLMIARENQGYTDFISLKKIRKNKGKIYWVTESWIQIGVAALIQKLKTKAGLKHPIFLGKISSGDKEYEYYNHLIKAKFILFRERDSHERMTQFVDEASKIETTFRMGLLGGIHLLGSDNNPIHIEKIHFDGHRHLRRKIDKKRILNRFILITTRAKEYKSIFLSNGMN